MLHRLMLGGVALALAGEVSIAAQTPQSQANREPTTILSGCLRSSRADATTADPKGVIYTLEVADAAATAPPPSTTAGTSTARADAVAKTRYSLSADASLNLNKHVDHQVEVTGQLQAPATTSGTAAAKPLPGGAHRTFQVAALKMLSAKCP